MSLASFLRDRAVQVVLLAVCALGVGSMLAVLNVGADAVALVSLFVFECGALGLALAYLRRRPFYRDLDALVDDLDRTYFVAELVEEPAFLEGRLAHRALEAVGKAASDDVSAHRRRAESYRDYVELWIHEIKTPIAAAELMAANVHGMQGAKIKGELARIEDYVEQALFYARSTSLERDYVIREVDLAEIVREVCRKHARLLIERGVTPLIEVPDDAAVFADAKWLAFAVGQIVTNAAKYGASEVRFSMRVEGEGGGFARTVLEVADDGRGIPAADVPRVFDHGFTGANGRAVGSSTGMGLYLVAVMCERMGLGVGLASEEGTGTRVMIAFPHDRPPVTPLSRSRAGASCLSKA